VRLRHRLAQGEAVLEHGAGSQPARIRDDRDGVLLVELDVERLHRH
jgi:hypothetical protein